MQKNSSIQEGSALISALFIMTLVAIAATAMSTRLQLDIYRTRLTIASDKLYLASQAISFWALEELSDKSNQFTLSDEHGKVREFPAKLQTIYPNTITKGSLYDLQSRFNLNNLSDKKYLSSFLKLLENTATKLSPSQRTALTMTLHSWLSPYQPGQDNALLSYYLKQKPPYFPSHQLMQNVSEFRLLQGVNTAVYRALLDYIIVLPEPTSINLNTAPKQLLKSLGNGLNETQVNELIEARGEKGILDLKDINPLLQKLNIRSEQVTIESQYFMSIAIISAEDLNLIKYSIIKRNKDKKGKISVSIISESLNSFG